MLQLHRLFAFLTLSATAALLTSLHLPQTQAALQESPKALVDQTWQIVHREYVDRTFNGNDWQAVRQAYLQRSYSSKEQAYQAIQTMLAKLEDPYTDFMVPQQIQQLASNVSGDFIGVGLTVALDPNTQEWVVVRAVPKAPAEAAGVQSSDVILKINGTPTPEIAASQISRYIIGPVGSQVSLQVRRGAQMLNLKLVRERLDLNPVTYRLQQTPAGKIGYIKIPVFTSKAPAAVRQAIQALEKQQVEGYILDLRSNPGGIYDSGLAIAQLWLRQGTITTLVDRRGRTAEQAKGAALTSKPLGVLVNGESASASEVLAAALQDNRRATLIGTKTFGKGLVQALEPLADGSGVRVTIAHYLTPKGQNINQMGIQPDVVVPLSNQQWQALNQTNAVATPADPQYARAVAELND
jgi:carboxyl-terminal processing protease